MTRYRFWIHDKDDKGRPLDDKLVNAAREVAPTLSRYRHDEIDCESTINKLLQSAVEAASRAKRSRPVENPIAYITHVYKRVADRFLKRRDKLVPVDESFLESLANTGGRRSFEDALNDRLLLEKLLLFMDPDIRKICNWRLQGYSMDEIAKELGIPRNSASVRYIRGLNKAANEMLQRNPRSNNNAKQEAV